MELVSLTVALLALVVAALIAIIDIRTWVLRSEAPWIRVTRNDDGTVEFRALGSSTLYDVRVTAVLPKSVEQERKQILDRPPVDVEGEVRDQAWVWDAAAPPLKVDTGNEDAILVVSWTESTRVGLRPGGLRVSLDSSSLAMAWWRYPWWSPGSARGRWRKGQ